MNKFAEKYYKRFVSPIIRDCCDNPLEVKVNFSVFSTYFKLGLLLSDNIIYAEASPGGCSGCYNFGNLCGKYVVEITGMGKFDLRQLTEKEVLKFWCDKIDEHNGVNRQIQEDDYYAV